MIPASLFPALRLTPKEEAMTYEELQAAYILERDAAHYFHTLYVMRKQYEQEQEELLRKRGAMRFVGIILN